jgi:hypothetical protein
VSFGKALHTIFYFMKMIFSLPDLAFSYYMKRRRAVSRFKMELIACGVPPGEARELAKLYPFKLRDAMNLARGYSEG